MPDIILRKKVKAKKKEDSEPASNSHRRKSECLELSLKYLYRRAFSESSLLDACDSFDFKEGHSYNFITAGDVDALSYLKAILRTQSLTHCLLSTWCMSAEDIYQLKEWLTEDRIKTLDCYVGEIFPSTYKVEFQMLNDLYNSEIVHGGRLAVCRNHSKIFAGIGDMFAFGIQSSANVNTNPRTEQGCITISKDLYSFYKEYFDGIKSFEYGKD